MARTPTTTHADAEGSPAFGNYERTELMRSILEIQKRMETKENKMLENEKGTDMKMNKMKENQKDMATKEQLQGMLQGTEKRLGKQLSTLEDKIDILIEVEARAKARREFADDFR